MDYQVLFNIVIGALGTIGGWALNSLSADLRGLQNADKELADKVASIEVLVAGRYVTREEFQQDMRALFGKIDRLTQLVNAKADR